MKPVDHWPIQAGTRTPKRWHWSVAPNGLGLNVDSYYGCGLEPLSLVLTYYHNNNPSFPPDAFNEPHSFVSRVTVVLPPWLNAIQAAVAIMLPLYSLFSFCLVAVNSVQAQYIPTDTRALTIKELEHYYLDAATKGFFSAITPCTNYQDPTAPAPDNTLGMQTAAEWIRTAFRKLPPSHTVLRTAFVLTTPFFPCRSSYETMLCYKY